MRLDRARTALLVIDLQNDTVGEDGAFASSGAPAFAREHDVVQRVERLAEAFRSADAPVLHVWHVDEPGHVDSTRNAELYRSIADADALVRGTWGAEPVVVPREGDLVVEKQRMSAFNSTTLDTKLRGLGATAVVCCGAWTNWAVEHTCRGRPRLRRRDRHRRDRDDLGRVPARRAELRVDDGRHARDR